MNAISRALFRAFGELNPEPEEGVFIVPATGLAMRPTVVVLPIFLLSLLLIELPLRVAGRLRRKARGPAEASGSATVPTKPSDL